MTLFNGKLICFCLIFPASDGEELEIIKKVKVLRNEKRQGKTATVSTLVNL